MSRNSGRILRGMRCRFWVLVFLMVFASSHALAAESLVPGVDALVGVYVTTLNETDRYFTGYAEFRPDGTWTRVTQIDTNRDLIPDEVQTRRGTLSLRAVGEGRAEPILLDDSGVPFAGPTQFAFRDDRVMAFAWDGLSYSRKTIDQPYFSYMDNKRPKAKAIVIRSVPEGATVFFDGQAQADRTPMTIKEPDAGVEHQIHLELPDFMPGFRTVTLSPNERMEIDFDLKEGLAQLWVKSVPRMRVFVDGALKGETPVKIDDLMLGEHQLRVSLDAWGVEKTETVVLDRGQILKRSYRFSGSLSLDVGRPVTLVDVKGKVIGAAPVQDFPLAVGRHLITLRDESGREKRVSVDIHLDQSTTFNTTWDDIP